MPLRDLPHDQQPRERLLRHGPQTLHDAELMAVLLGTGGRAGAMATARALLSRFPDLRRLAAAGIAELTAVSGVGLAQACRVKAALALAGRLAEAPLRRGQPLAGPRDVFQRIGRSLVALEREVFFALPLDVKHRVLGELKIADGGVCSVRVVPRDLFAAILREAPAAVVFVHNHPSGDPTPSQADVELTERLREAALLLGVGFIDHIIVGHDRYYSFTHAGISTA